MQRPTPTYVVTQTAARQDGVVTRVQLLAAGITRHEIQNLRNTGLLQTALPGIYVLGAAPLSHRQFLRVALFSAGPGALLANRTAAEHLGLLRLTDAHASVLPPAGRGPSRSWTQVPVATTGRRAQIIVGPSVKPDRGLTHAGLRTTTVARTLIGVAGSCSEPAFEWAWKDAEFRNLLRVDELRAELDGSSLPGSRLVSSRLKDHVAVTQGTKFIGRDEVPFLKLMMRAGLPTPKVNHPLHIAGQRHLADFFFDPGLVVELDEPGHLSPTARDQDVLRDAAFVAAGLVVMRFLTVRVNAEPDRCLGLIRETLTRVQANHQTKSGIWTP